MSSSPTAQRGMILLEQKRYPEAEKYFREALAADPNDPFALYHLAVCESHLDRDKQALETIERALALAPETADFHSLRALILIDLRRVDDSLKASAEALRLEPDSDFALTARAQAFLSRNEWASAELAARKALEFNPDNSFASNQLTNALRAQNRLTESAEQSDYMLAQDPESAHNHISAGWLALQRGDNGKAEEHFLEALRLEANNEYARTGLKEAFKARSPLYRKYLDFCFLMQRFTRGKQWLVFLGLYLAINTIPRLLPGPLALALIVGYFLFVLWMHLAGAVGNFQLLFDRRARHALNRPEKWEAVSAGGALVAGLLFVASGLILGYLPATIIGLTLIAGAFPFAYVFTNTSTTGRFIFAAAAGFIYFAGLLNLAAALHVVALGKSTPILFANLAGLTVVAVTWLAAVPSLRRR